MNEEFFIGKPKTQSSQSQKSKLKNFKLEQGSNLFRLLPPMWSLAEKGEWYKYWRIHWGFTDTRGTPRPIVCLERKTRDGAILNRCPIDEMIESRKSQLELLKSNGASEQETKEYYDLHIQPYEPRGHYHAYAISSDGELGLLKFGKTVRDAIDQKIDELEAEGVELMGINGVYINIKRTGQGRFSTKYSVEVAMVQDPNNPKAKVYKEHVLTSELLNHIQASTRDLAKLYTPYPLEDLETLVNETDPEERKKIVDSMTGRNNSSNDSGASGRGQVKTTVPGTGATALSSLKVDHSTASVTMDGPKVNSVAKTESDTAATVQKETVVKSESVEDIDDFMAKFQEDFG